MTSASASDYDSESASPSDYDYDSDSASPSALHLTLAVSAGVAIALLAGAAVAQPNSDVYAYPDIEPAVALATEAVTVVRAPSPGLVTAYRQSGPAAAGLSFERPIVVAAPFAGRGYTESAGAALTLTGIAAGN